MHKWLLLATGCKWLPVQFDAKCLPRTGSSLKAAPHYSLPSLPQQLNDRNTNKKESVAVLKQAFWPREGDRHAAAKPGWPPAPGGDGCSPLSSPHPHASELIPSVTRFSPLSKPHMEGWLSSGWQDSSVSPRKRWLVRCLLPLCQGKGQWACSQPRLLFSLKLLHAMLSHWKLCLSKSTAKIGGKALERHPQMPLMGVYCVCLLCFSSSGTSTSWGLVSLKTHLPSLFEGVSCPCAGWSMNCRFWQYGPFCVSYCWYSVLPYSVDAGPKITLRLSGLVGSRCVGNTVHLAAEKGDVLAPLSLEHVSSS